MRPGHAISHRGLLERAPTGKSAGKRWAGAAVWDFKNGRPGKCLELVAYFRLSRNCRGCGGSAAKNGPQTKREVESANCGHLISPHTVYTCRRTIFLIGI